MHIINVASSLSPPFPFYIIFKVVTIWRKKNKKMIAKKKKFIIVNVSQTQKIFCCRVYIYFK